jgi:hypothetical protein
MSDTDQLIPEDLDDDEPLRAELRLCFVGSSGIVKEPPYQLQHAQDVQLGREKSCSLWIEDSVVSELHASIHPQLTEKGWQVELRDCESRNGTFVNGVKIDRCLLRSGDVIRVGNSLLHFQVSRIGDEDYPIPGVIGCSPAIRHLRTQIEVFAPTTNSILILGESGVGKEVVAQAIHKLSRRPGKLVATNCANIEKTLADSTLFGHKRGAFTGATEDRAGLFQTAHTGTLFLDEVGELAKDVQPSFCARSRRKPFCRLAANTRFTPMRAASPRPTSRSPRPWTRVAFARISTTDWPGCCWKCRRCAIVATTSCCSPSTFCQVRSS